MLCFVSYFSIFSFFSHLFWDLNLFEKSGFILIVADFRSKFEKNTTNFKIYLCEGSMDTGK